MMTKKINGRVFEVCTLVLFLSFLSLSGARADENQFNDNGDGTVYDANSGLTWEQASHGPFNWHQALGYVESLNADGFAGCDSWVLPSRKELKRIVDHHKQFGTRHINTSYFPDTLPDFYWSSSSHRHNDKYAISFGSGHQKKRPSTDSYYVRAVRGECNPDDKDGDGYPGGSDCNDNDPSIHPGAFEICDDGVDNDCSDGDDLTCRDEDNDGDGQTENEGDCDDHDSVNFSGNPEICDGMDNDCDTVVDNGLNFDVDGDGHNSENSCSGTNDDCVDADADIYPGRDEICDSKDNDCDGSTDEDLTQPTTCGVGACAGNTGVETCTDDGVWGGDTCDPLVGATAENCDNIDNNCNGNIDENLTQPTTCGVGECGATGILTCTVGTWANDTCVAGTPSAEICDNLDNNCDGSADNGVADIVSGTDVGECQVGIQSCIGGAFEVIQAEIGASAETCDNLDNNCNGSVDENLTQSTTCGVGACAGNIGEETCAAGVWIGDTCDPLAGATAEICDDSIDNDCDASVNEDCALPSVQLGVYYYDFIQDAYDTIGDGDTVTIKLQEIEFGESLIIWGNDVTVTLTGGYDELFTEPSTGWATIASSGPTLTISNGTVIIEYIILR